MSGALLRQIFLFQGSLFEDQCPFSSDSQACPARDFQADASTAGNQTTKEKTAQSSNPTNRMKRESDLVQDKYSEENTYFDKSQLSDCYEYKENEKICVRGRLKANIRFWKDIDACKFIIETIDSGYKIPFYSLPQGRFAKNNNSALQEDEFVRGAIKYLFPRNLKYLL